MNCNTQLFISLWMLLQKIHYHSFMLVNRASFNLTKITVTWLHDKDYFHLYSPLILIALLLQALIGQANLTRSCWFSTTNIKSRQREKLSRNRKNIYILNTHTFQNPKLFKDCSCIVRLLCRNDLIPFIRSLYSMLHSTLWIHTYVSLQYLMNYYYSCQGDIYHPESKMLGGKQLNKRSKCESTLFLLNTYIMNEAWQMFCICYVLKP